MGIALRCERVCHTRRVRKCVPVVNHIVCSSQMLSLVMAPALHVVTMDSQYLCIVAIDTLRVKKEKQERAICQLHVKLTTSTEQQ